MVSKKIDVNHWTGAPGRKVWRRMSCESSTDAAVGQCVWYLCKSHTFFHLFLGKDKKIGVLANASANCDLFFTTVRNAKLYCICFPSRKGHIPVLFFLDVPYFYLSKLKTKASVSPQPLLLNLEHGSEDLFRKVLFKSRLWSRNPALLGLQARLTTVLIVWYCCTWISADCSCG